jgi:hypothetical protein
MSNDVAENQVGMIGILLLPVKRNHYKALLGLARYDSRPAHERFASRPLRIFEPI